MCCLSADSFPELCSVNCTSSKTQFSYMSNFCHEVKTGLIWLSKHTVFHE